MAQTPDDGLGHARQTVRNAAHHIQHMHRRHRQDPPWFLGVVMVLLGVVFLLDNLDIIEARFFFRNMWPVLALIFGLGKVIFGRPDERIFGAVAAVFGGAWLADRVLDWDINIVGLFWPLILVGLGLGILFKGRSQLGFPVPPIPPVPGSAFDAEPTTAEPATPTDLSASIREVAIMGGVERRNISQSFRGGSITAVMGSIELDLRDCRIADEAAHIAVQVVLGQVVLRLPREWAVDSRIGAVLGNLEDRSDPPVAGTQKRLVLEGSLFLSQIEIRN